MDKKSARIRRATRARRKLQSWAQLAGGTSYPRHIYAQVIAPNGSEVLVAASTVEKAIAEQLKYTGNKDAAAAVGKAVAERALEKASKMYPLTVPGSNIMVVSGTGRCCP